MLAYLLLSSLTIGNVPAAPAWGPRARCIDQGLQIVSPFAPGLGPAWQLEVPRWLAWAWRPATMQVVPRSSPPEPGELMRTARDHLGVPYVWGGLGEGGYDCSGFVNKVYAENGYDLPRTSREQFKIGSDVPKSALGTGDLLFFVSNPGDLRITHVAMYVADDEFIHAAMGKGQVTYDRLTSRYYAQRFFGARRVLTLPPGVYSSANGAARSTTGEPVQPLGDEPTIEQIIRNAPPPTDQSVSTGAAGGGEPGTGAPVIERILTEHAADERPPQLLASFAKGAVTHVGPSLLRPQETSVGLRLGVGGLEGVATTVAAPEFTYFGHDDALHVALAVPFEVPLEGRSAKVSTTLKQAWDEPKEYAKVLQELRYGQKESELYAELGRTASGTLGHGQLMRYYTPNVDSRSVPDYVLTTDALSLSFDGSVPWGGGESFIDDILNPKVVGALLWARPAVLADASDAFLKTISVGVAWAGDLRAPYLPTADGKTSERAVHGGTLDVEVKPLKTDGIDLKAYVAGSGLVAPTTTGFGGTLGTLLRANLGGRIAHVIRLRLEGQLSSPTFIPTYFDTTYRLNRAQAPVDEIGATPLTKLALLEELAHSPKRWGIYGELAYKLHHRMSVLLAYEDGGTLGSVAASERYVGRKLQLVWQVNGLYLPGSSRSLSFYVAYQLSNFHKLLPLLAKRRANEYVFAALTLQAWRHVGFSAALRKGYNPARPTVAAVDGVLSVVASYEI